LRRRQLQPCRGKLKDVGCRGGPEAAESATDSARMCAATSSWDFAGYLLNASDAIRPRPTKFKAPRDFRRARWRAVITIFSRPRDGTPVRSVAGNRPLAVNDIRTVTVDNGAGLNGSFSGGAKAGAGRGRSWPGQASPCRPRTWRSDIGLPVSSGLGKPRNRRRRSLWRWRPASLNAHELTVGMRFLARASAAAQPRVPARNFRTRNLICKADENRLCRTFALDVGCRARPCNLGGKPTYTKLFPDHPRPPRAHGPTSIEAPAVQQRQRRGGA